MPISKNFIITLVAGLTFGFFFSYLIFDVKNSPEAQTGEVTQAERLAQQVRVLCWVMTTPANHATKAIHVKNTWGKRCNKLLFMSSQSDEKLGAIAVPNTSEGREFLLAKSTGAFTYVWEHHRDEADWFMKADDDTYVILENLRFMLRQYDPKDPIYFGCNFHLPSKEKYMSGGAGYVLSKEALRRFVKDALPDKNKCKQTRKDVEDVEVGQCLEAVGVVAGDSRDALGRYRFMPFDPESHVFEGGAADRTDWYWEYIYYPQEHGPECCSDMAISFHYIKPSAMYALDYLIYRVWLYGTSPNYLENLSTTLVVPLEENSTTVSQSDDLRNSTE